VWRDTAVGLVLIGLAGLYWLGADQIRVSRLEGGVGAQAVPKSLALVLAFLAALMIAQAAWQRYRAGAGAAAAPVSAEERRRHLRALGMLLIGVGYLLVVDLLGYLPTIALLLLATATYIGRPFSAHLAGVAVAGSVLYYLLFVRFLDIPLPAGIWPDLWRTLAG